MSNGSERTPERKLTSAGLEHRPQADFDIATNRPLGPEGQDNFDALLSRIAALEAVVGQIRAVRSRRKTWHGFSLQEEAELDAILDTAPSTVLDQMIREAKAEAWMEGGRYGFNHQPYPVYGTHNPYRNGDA